MKRKQFWMIHVEFDDLLTIWISIMILKRTENVLGFLRNVLDINLEIIGNPLGRGILAKKR